MKYLSQEAEELASVRWASALLCAADPPGLVSSGAWGHVLWAQQPLPQLRLVVNMTLQLRKCRQVTRTPWVT